MNKNYIVGWEFSAQMDATSNTQSPLFSADKSNSKFILSYARNWFPCKEHQDSPHELAISTYKGPSWSLLAIIALWNEKNKMQQTTTFTFWAPKSTRDEPLSSMIVVVEYWASVKNCLMILPQVAPRSQEVYLDF